ncbi:DUF1801 domain-containing protein [Bowmanella yangjiangensis]|uniref:DUF1801 domain-containing protein n=1 Tax=Bowmanella yangjiangensis TaxID=2811230 RepID=A0ABS3CT22_9ALTE|nr:DUF1801 domain-containing protein [Bowmanella yangjiangensis]MBN7820268.1 DUF1801 domain-containing protein [Bowmanella yangjiangensis]
MNTDVQIKIDSYPAEVRPVFSLLRQWLYDIAAEKALNPVSESLKWAEPSYSVQGGSTVRMDWKAGRPEMIQLYFHCQTQLVETFRELYPQSFEFEGNRALLLPVSGSLPEAAIKHCLHLALTYHKRKHLPLLGAC